VKDRENATCSLVKRLNVNLPYWQEAQGLAERCGKTGMGDEAELPGATTVRRCAHKIELESASREAVCWEAQGIRWNHDPACGCGPQPRP